MKMPLLFVGHGSPMNAIEDNIYTKTWKNLGETLPKPKAILVISAHWYTRGTKISDDENPKMIYDMYGFPEELYKVVYSSKGSSELAHRTKDMIEKEAEIDNTWGYDHGLWSILHVMFPKADIPVYQLSVDKNSLAKSHFMIGENIKKLREEGVLIVASGNIVHNLALIDFYDEGGFPWAKDFDEEIKKLVFSRDFEKIIDYKLLPEANKAVPIPDHFYPLLYILGASDTNDEIEIFNYGCTMGSLSMTSYIFK